MTLGTRWVWCQMHELLGYLKPQSLFYTAIIPGIRLWFCESTGCIAMSFNQYQYAIILTHVIACMLQTFCNVAPSSHACQFFIQGLALRYAFIYIISNSCYMVTWYVDNINFNKLLWNYEFMYCKNLLSLKIRPFYKNFILRKFGAIR